MMRICLHYIPDKQIAQDLLHDGFIVIFTSIETLRTPEKLESWMGIIMKNISLRYLNQRVQTLQFPYLISLKTRSLLIIRYHLILFLMIK